MRKPEGVAVCYVCDSAEVNDLELGEFHKSGKVAVHYFCLLLTSGLVQNGDEHQGLFGFLLKDIRAEVERIKRLVSNAMSLDKWIGCGGFDTNAHVPTRRSAPTARSRRPTSGAA